MHLRLVPSPQGTNFVSWLASLEDALTQAELPASSTPTAFDDAREALLLLGNETNRLVRRLDPGGDDESLQCLLLEVRTRVAEARRALFDWRVHGAGVSGLDAARDALSRAHELLEDAIRVAVAPTPRAAVAIGDVVLGTGAARPKLRLVRGGRSA
jgi:hypothetical protein